MMQLSDIFGAGVLLLTVTTLVGASSTTNIWSSYWIRAKWMTSLIHDDYLYLSGGGLTSGSHANPTTVLQAQHMGSVLRIDLKSYWTPANVSVTYSDKPLMYPYARGETLWTDGSHLYAYGGTPFAVPGCTTTCLGGVWRAKQNKTTQGINTKIANLPLQPWRVPLDSFGTGKWEGPLNIGPSPNSPIQGSLTAFYEGKYYSLGGFSNWPYWYPSLSNDNILYKTSGMVSWNPDGSGWRNQSSAGYKPGGAPSYGVAIATPFGPEGTILSFGGVAPIGDSFAFGAQDQPLQNLSKISIFDIKSGDFTQQTATGDIPQNRWNPCAVGVSETGTNTFDIYFYGGYSGTSYDEIYSASLAAVYVLSLPSFVWTTAIPGSQPYMRASHTCEVGGLSQMIVVGGMDPTDTSGPGYTVDPWPNGIGILNLNDWNWKQEYNPAASVYKRNKKLTAAAKKTPFPKKWDSGLAEMLFHPAAKPYHVPVESAGKNNGDDSNLAAIVGGIVGGLAGITLLLGIALYFWRRRKLEEQRREEMSKAMKIRNAELPGHEAKGAILLPTHEKPTELNASDKSLPPTPTYKAEYRPQHFFELPTSVTKSRGGSIGEKEHPEDGQQQARRSQTSLQSLQQSESDF